MASDAMNRYGWIITAALVGVAIYLIAGCHTFHLTVEYHAADGKIQTILDLPEPENDNAEQD